MGIPNKMLQGMHEKYCKAAGIRIELRRLLIRQFNNLRTMDSADFELIARLECLDHGLALGSAVLV
jgi:hypothetical protein